MYVTLGDAKVEQIQAVDAWSASKCKQPGKNDLLALLLAGVWKERQTRRKEKF